MQISIKELKEYCRYKSIILVGNGKEVTDCSNGDLIDSYDLVVRMNHGYVRQGYEKNMGIKTDIWALAYNRQNEQIEEYK